MLHQPIIDVNHQPYCGPLAIAALTGVPLSRAEFMIRRLRRGYKDSRGRKKPIQGTWRGEVQKVLERLGCKLKPMHITENTLGRFVEDTHHIKAAFLVNLPGHWVVVSEGVTAEHKRLDLTPKRPQRRVTAAWRVDAPTVPKYTMNDPLGPQPPKKEPKPKPPIQQVRYEQVLASIKRWETKAKRAKTALKKLNEKRKYYERELAKAQTLPPPTLERPVVQEPGCGAQNATLALSDALG